MIPLIVGHPRTGTSMMMEVLEAGGLAIAASTSREIHNWTDGVYKPNAGGFRELDPSEMREPTWPRQHDGKAIKCLTHWVRNLAVHDYMVIFMERDSEEVRQSYEAAFGVRKTVAAIESEMREARRTLVNRRDVRGVHALNYADVVRAPRPYLRAVERWLGIALDVDRASAVVKEHLYRFRREKLVVGL